MNIFIINGPNINRLGLREPHIYGHKTYDDLVKELTIFSQSMGVNLTMRQTNHEGLIIDWLHEANQTVDAVILNAGALTHYSYAIYDAIKSIDVPVIEVHLTDIKTRVEPFRHTSVIESACKKTFTGKGFESYKDAIRDLLKDVT